MFHFYQFRNLRSRDTRAVLAVLSVSLSFTYREYRLYSSIVHLYQFRYLKSRCTQAVVAFWSVFVLFIHSTVVHLYQLRCVKNQHTQAVFSKLFCRSVVYFGWGLLFSLRLNFLHLFIYVSNGQRRGHCNCFGVISFIYREHYFHSTVFHL